MAKWVNTVDFSAEKQAYKNGEITLQQLAAAAAKAVERADKGLDHNLWCDKQDIVLEFEDIAASDAADPENFDDVLTMLYDWADTRLDDHWGGRKVAWVVP